MDGIHPHFTVRTSFSFLLLILLQTSAEAQDICSVPGRVQFAENNTVGELVVTITVQPGVTVSFKPPPANPNNPFRLEGYQLIADRVLDFETARSHVAEITCTAPSGLPFSLNIIVLVTNVNDNPPVFEQSTYYVDVNEMAPVNTSVGRYSATDLDGHQLYYMLTSESNGFKLRSPTSPDILVQTPLEYDKVKNVQLILHAQDTPLTPPSSEVSYTASTTIMVTILDVDNRPPWFQPCTALEIGGVVICQSFGYTGMVVQHELATGALPLRPGPLYAIDGDSGINETITYSILSGNGDGLFEINPNTGNISMLKPTDRMETINLTVMAAQNINRYQFSTTTVTISVQLKSDHRPQFQRPLYQGVVTGVGTMALDLNNKDVPLYILATDDDYASDGGRNPYITYDVQGHADFSIIDNYLFMTKNLPDATYPLEVLATDEFNGESAKTEVQVEVTSGLTTTSVPLTTGESTTIGKTTEDIVSTTMTTESIISTSKSSMPTEGSVATTDPSQTTEGSVSTASTTHAHTVIVPSGGYRLVDMAALGATLGVLLFICLVVIGVLVFRIRRGKADWQKIYETSMFCSSLGQGSGNQKEGIQYTNDAFQNDDDGDSTRSGSPQGGNILADDSPPYETILESSVPPHVDNSSQAGSDKADSEKEVKPILTKERRMDEGYKSVWFKEDIVPDAKEEVVIIPDSRENDSEEEDEEEPSSSREEDEDDNLRMKTLRVVFNDADLDSGLGVKMEDPAEDSEDDKVLNVDL